MIFADPPYFLSNGGISYQAGKVVCVNKGDWDKGGTRSPSWSLTANGCLYAVKSLKTTEPYGFPGPIIIFFQ